MNLSGIVVMAQPQHVLGVVEALKALPSYGVDDYVFPSRPTTRWPEPVKPYR